MSEKIKIETRPAKVEMTSAGMAIDGFNQGKLTSKEVNFKRSIRTPLEAVGNEPNFN